MSLSMKKREGNFGERENEYQRSQPIERDEADREENIEYEEGQ